MLSLELVCCDMDAWYSGCSQGLEYLAIASVVTEGNAAWDTWSVELSVTLWLFMKAVLQLFHVSGLLAGSNVWYRRAAGGTGLVSTLAALWAATTAADNWMLWLSTGMSALSLGTELVRTAKEWWLEYWNLYYEVNQISALRKAMTVKFKCSDGIVRDFLLDTGAAASLVRHALFGKVCSKMGLRPSMLRLSAASGKDMKSRGNAVLHLRLPEQSMQDPPMISHAFEVMEDGAMPAGLQITGVGLFTVPVQFISFSKAQYRQTRKILATTYFGQKTTPDFLMQTVLRWPLPFSQDFDWTLCRFENGSYSRSRYELENKCVIHSGCVVVVWSLVELFVEFDCCVNCSRVAWLVAVR